MILSDVCIRRPVFSTMLVSALMVLGVASYFSLGVDLFPKIDLPNVVVTTAYPGAGPEEVETQITKVIEEAVNTISGIDELRSTSFEGLSQVVVVFKLERDPDICAQDVRDRVGRVISELPQGIDSPIIEKFDPDAAPVITVVVSADMPVKELTEVAKKSVKESIETVSGVGQVSMVGAREREIHVRLDADRLIALGVTAGEVKQALVRQNVELPGGLVETGPRDLILRTMGRIARVEDFEDVVVTVREGTPIVISDVAQVEDAQEELRSLARLNGRSAIALVVRKQSGTNTVEVIESIRAKLVQIEKILPKGARMETVRDQSRFILGSFHAVMEHLVMGSLLASLCVFVFLGDLRSTIIASLAIPTSIVATFTLMQLNGFTLNQMSLLALVLAVGIVIDDAIVVLENIYRHMSEEGRDPVSAAHEGTREIGLAVMATTLSLVVIFVPIAFMPGIIGRFFMSFGLTMVYAILVSMFISFTLTPMLCSRFLKLGAGGHGEDQPEGWFDRLLTRPYIAMLRFSLQHKFLICLVAGVITVSTVPLMQIVGKDFIPLDDQSEFLVDITAPEGTSIHRTEELLAEIGAHLRAIPEVASTLATIGEQSGRGLNEGSIYVALVDIHERQKDQFALMNEARDYLLTKHPDLQSMVRVVPQISGGGFKQVDVQLTFRGPNLEKLEAYADEVVEVMGGIEGLVDLDTSLSEGKPELRVVVDRQRAAVIGVDLTDLAATLRTLIGGDEELVTKFKDVERSEEYEVRVRLADRFRDEPDDILTLPVRSKGGSIPLRAIAQVVRGVSPTQIDRYDRQRQVSIEANLDGIGLGDAQKVIDEKLATMTLEPGYSYGYLGRSKVMKEQNYGFLLAFLLSSIFVYMILAAQFESFAHPVTILASLPLCIPFGILSLVLTGERMQLYSTLGLFMLFGIVKKNAILQVDYANHLRERGVERHDAILQSNRTRLRPILMTTLTLVAGMIPTAFGTGPGSGSRRSMAIVIIGGQSLCLLITLLLTPVVYTLLDDLSNSRLVNRVRRALS